MCASVTYDSLHPTLRLFRDLKRLRPHVTTILGGPHVDEVHDIQQFKNEAMPSDVVDYAVAGDGEYALRTILSALTRGQSQCAQPTEEGQCGNFSVYRHGQCICEGHEPLDPNLLPVLPIEMADTERRRMNLGRLLRCPELSPVVEMIAHRGCRFQCDCCSERLGAISARSIQSIIDEIELRRSNGFRMVFFNDSTFGNYPQLKELLIELERTGMLYGCLNRFDRLTQPGVLELYRRAGFRYFYCAVEQFEDSMLKRIDKAENTQRMLAGMALLHDMDFIVGVSLLYRMPFETEGSIRQTLEFVERWVNEGTIKLVSQSILTFRPATPFGCNLKEGFDRVPPNRGYPLDRFEEGQWYHLEPAGAPGLDWILKEAEQRFKSVLVRSID